MLGALKSFAGAFVELEESPAKANTPSPPPAAAPVPKAPSTSTAAVDASVEMIQLLQKKIMDRTTPYTALVENAKTLEDYIPDEVNRLKAAFKMVSKDGQRPVSSIVQAIDVHIQDIEGERLRFKAASTQQIQAAVGSMRNQSAALQQQVKDAQAKLEQLAAEQARLQELIGSNNTKVLELDQKANETEANIVATGVQFENAVEIVKADLTNKKSSLITALS